ncbi:MAG: lamin tail domain-containing protein [Alphaproteobacteria bacterium]|nr:lamin tail domain-containing protein [Alphaproteobacteria bacterium]
MRSMRALFVVVVAAGCSPEQQFRRIEEPPDVAIVTPEELQIFRQGAGPLPFEGTATDSYDAPEELEAFWSVDAGEEIAGEVQTDGVALFPFDADALDLGPHTLTLRVVDTDADEASVTVDWLLDGSLTGPDVDLYSPDEGTTFGVGVEIGFRGRATDNNTDPADLQWSWTDDVDGPLSGAISGDGQSVVFASLTPGVHTVTLTVTDKDGEKGADWVTVTVSDDGGTEPTEPTTTEPTEPITEAQVGDLVFSELMVKPTLVEDEVGEWVELYNTSSTPIQIQGYSFHDQDIDAYTIADSAIVQPFDFIVLCASTNANLNGGVPCDVHFERNNGGAGNMALGNNGDEVILSRPDGLVIDQVVYDGTWFTAGAATGLDPAHLDASNNDNESMWCDQVTPIGPGRELGTPGAPNDPCR